MRPDSVQMVHICHLRGVTVCLLFVPLDDQRQINILLVCFPKDTCAMNIALHKGDRAGARKRKTGETPEGHQERHQERHQKDTRRDTRSKSNGPSETSQQR
ncbi:hypothetical protein NHX12_022015 [Muraenolepis orangiensis]|uniref:Uncharacterized protein n=1 Tax=Muraenolepis orangiensis TaxID=630683 RepID=A0A9Q0EMW7_9TELE|nr:hypothetical protein NHX12_022015 [Muraenolepis orangiensis]